MIVHLSVRPSVRRVQHILYSVEKTIKSYFAIFGPIYWPLLQNLYILDFEIESCAKTYTYMHSHLEVSGDRKYDQQVLKLQPLLYNDIMTTKYNQTEKVKHKLF